MNSKINLSPPVFTLNNVKTPDLQQMLYTMMLIREFEETIADLVLDHKIITPCHLYTGQEAVATGACYALRKDDYLFGNHRSHGHYLAKGGDLKQAMAEIFCRATGCSSGRGGSMHLCSPSVGIMGTSSIVAGSMAIAVGTALAESIRMSDRVTVVFHGDGVPEEGIWHESANLAGLKRLPVLFVCENNQYCTHMAINKRRKYNNLARLATEHGFNSTVVDGNNVLEVYNEAREAVHGLRQGKGPAFIEAQTYRWRGHVGPNYDVDLGLRSEKELEAWMDRCPIKHFSNFLVRENILSIQDVTDLQKQAKNEIIEAVDYAVSCPYPDPSEIMKYLYKGENVWG